MKRPEYVTCIRQTYDENKSWCERDLSMSFAFINIGHAQAAVAKGSRLTICHECWTKIQDKVDLAIEHIEKFTRGE